ncbi:MAG TPA: extracellular solute-binding protein [Anaerolineae bacterium]|nr:extracellular solute-binding protein [Anaerolineae bacterium]
MLKQNLILLGGLLLTLIACVPPTPPPSPTPWPTATATPAPVEAAATPRATPTPTRTPASTPTPPITNILVWENLPAAQGEALAEDIESFQKEFAYFTVTLRHYDNPENFMTPLMAGETQFDVVLASPVLLGSLWSADQLAPMSDFFAPTFLDGFASVTLLGASRDNKLWGLSDTAGFHLLLFYNRDLVDPPPADTEELLELAEDLAQSDSIQGLGVNSYDPLWLVPWLSPYGGWLTNAAGRPTLDTTAMQKALALYLRWQDRSEGIAPVATYDEVRAQFLAGNLAMVIDGEWAIGELARAADINWGVAPLPSVVEEGDSQPAAPLVLARYWAVSRSASGDHALAAATFLEFVTRPERQLERAVRFGLLPTRRQALDDPVIVNDSALRLSSEQMLAGRTVPLGTNADALLNAMREPLRQALEGDLTPEQAAEMMQTNAER